MRLIAVCDFWIMINCDFRWRWRWRLTTKKKHVCVKFKRAELLCTSASGSQRMKRRNKKRREKDAVYETHSSISTNHFYPFSKRRREMRVSNRLVTEDLDHSMMNYVPVNENGYYWAVNFTSHSTEEELSAALALPRVGIARFRNRVHSGQGGIVNDPTWKRNHLECKPWPF